VQFLPFKAAAAAILEKDRAVFTES